MKTVLITNNFFQFHTFFDGFAGGCSSRCRVHDRHFTNIVIVNFYFGHCICCTKKMTSQRICCNWKKFRKLKIHVKLLNNFYSSFIPIVTPPSFGEAAEATTPSTTEVITLPSASVKAKVVPPGLVPPEPPLGCRVSVTIDEPEVKECILVGCCSEIGNSTLSILPYFYDVWPILEHQLGNLTLRMLLGDFANTFQTRKPYKWIVMVWKSQKNSVGITNLLFKKFTIQNCNEGPLND